MQRYRIIELFLKRVKKPIVLLFIYHLAANVCTLILPLIITQMYAHLLDFDSARAKVFTLIAPALSTIFNSFSALSLLLFNVLAVRFFLDFMRQKQQGFLSEAFQHDLRSSIFKHHLKMDIAIYEQGGVSRYLLRFGGELSSVNQFWTKGILQFGADVLLLLLGWVVIAFINFWVALFSLVLLGLFFIVFKLLNKKIETIESTRRNRKGQLLAFFNTRLLAITSIQAFNKENTEHFLFERQSLKVKNEGNKYHHWAALSDSLVNTALYFILGCSLLLILFEKKNNPSDFNTFSTLTLILILLTWRQPLLRIFKVGLIWKKGLLSLDALNRFFERPLNAQYNIEATAMTPSVLDFENVVFKVNNINIGKIEKVKVLNKNIKILETQSAEIWMKILAGLKPYTEGGIKLDDKEFTHLNPRSIRRHIAFSSPVFPLYGKTVLEAISSSVKKEHRKKMREILSIWSKHFTPLSNLRPDTPFHETGLGLSLAQHQLLRLLNALSNKKPFLIVDEPLAFLDAETADKVWQLLLKEAETKGVLIFSKDVNPYELRLRGNSYLHKINDNP